MVKAEDTPFLNGEAMSVDVKPESDMKSEPPASPPYVPMELDDMKDTRRSTRNKKSASSTPPLQASSSSSKKPSPSPAATPLPSTKPSKPPAPGPQLIGDLPIAREDALDTFNEITYNNYQNKSIGKSKEMFESMTCDCVYEHGVDDEDVACGPWSDCINRLTQVECLPDDCRCGPYCQNQRFQRRQYAKIDIVLTEMKGFGLRAEERILKDTFIYEYVGDVVSPPSFKKRMRDYALEGIQHFYFMMLQKDEFIDATKSGGIGRFANHSCNPNCYVAKWTVGKHVRMGIFSKRDIQKHEELTFNYNVDRYGHQAQTCYCGEPNCVGFIGGKTQTDIVTMDDLYLDALGITDEDDVAALKGTKKKKGKKIDDLDFMPRAKTIVESEVPKVVQAIRQTTSKKVLLNILTRVKITEDQAALRQIMRLRGYSVMKNLLDDYSDDLELVQMVLECLKTWPLLNRNKVDDSMIAGSLEAVLEKHEQQSFKDSAQELLEHWKTLPVYTRIPKKKAAGGDYKALLDSGDVLKRKAEEDARKADYFEKRKQALKKEREAMMMMRLEVEVPVYVAPKTRVAVPQGPTRSRSSRKQRSRSGSRQKLPSGTARKETERAERHARKKAKAEKEKEKKKKVTTEQREAEKQANKEKRLLKLVGAVVVGCMSKYAKNLNREMFKKYAKELTQVIADKEKKASTYKDDRLEALSEEKQAKIKKFSKDYIAKVLKKLADKGYLASSHGTGNGPGLKHRPSVSLTPTNATASSSTHTPQSLDGGDASMMGDLTMSVEEAMDMDPESGSEDDHDDEADAEGEIDDDFEDLHLGMPPPGVKRSIPEPTSSRTSEGGVGAGPLQSNYGGPPVDGFAGIRRPTEVGDDGRM
ncbi:histone-lysine N-methyltransferase [Ephemerocybe angulata]|uniref:Histone-lysine N-methyltransferase, H3 lysine-36 specific n=1 Tax=Ephemerocybe angulata TaxID=980116 RepID=A0A8H6M2K7_9AGAR|nr:histone-lysine N-methyltransferase [Tulosesus angulatus]